MKLSEEETEAITRLRNSDLAKPIRGILDRVVRGAEERLPHETPDLHRAAGRVIGLQELRDLLFNDTPRK